ncbi:MAG: hypothetical protein ORN98_00960, partial [Alphaproteobacteria bacterium]|nr:hypothetical protein [Alphaproteobacteria bacterium]
MSMSSLLAIGMTINMYDNMTGPMKKMIGQTEQLRGKMGGLVDVANRVSEQWGKSFAATTAVMALGAKSSISAYADLEDSQLQLKSVVMRKDGSTPFLNELTAQVVELGNALPGTTATYNDMYST